MAVNVARNSNPATNGSAEDLSPFPILAEVVNPVGGGTTAAAPGPVGAVAENALREVLGWRPKATDPKAFLAALTQSFSVAEIDGVTTVRWQQRGYAIAADLGAVTGAQASVFTRTKVILDQAQEVLNGLQPLVVTT